MTGAIPDDAHPATDETTPAPTTTAHRAALALGSNLGNRLENLQGAVDALGDTPRTSVIALSRVYETDPVGGPEQEAYFNGVVIVETALPPAMLLERAHAIEEAFQRVRTERWGPRTLDIDILTYDDLVSDADGPTLPHPRAHERGFVLAPWHDADAEAVVPGRGRVGDLLAVVGRDGVRLRSDLVLRFPE